MRGIRIQESEYKTFRTLFQTVRTSWQFSVIFLGKHSSFNINKRNSNCPHHWFSPFLFSSEMSHRANSQGMKRPISYNPQLHSIKKNSKISKSWNSFCVSFLHRNKNPGKLFNYIFFQSIVVCTVLLKCLWNNGLNSPDPNRNFQLLLTNPKYCFLVCWVSWKHLGTSYYPTPVHLSLTYNLSRITLLLY